MDSRISKERRPGYIIPFRKTREDCKKSYARMMSRAFFAPKELKDAEQVEKFRGIYMPYWVYSFEKHGPIAFTGTKSHRRGDYRITKYYRLNCEIDEAYKGLSFDASSSFSDNLSSAIAPFDLTEGKPFTPSYLSGFYADTNDVEKDVYRTDAQNIMLNDAADELASKPVCRRYNVTEGSMHSVLRPSGYTAELAMLPVWFLSYRKGDRVCYAVVNGQTGKAAADLPIEPKKYLIGSAILAVPLFVLLNLFFTFTPATILMIAAVLALISLLISNKQMNRIFARERGEDDKGLKAAKAKMAKAVSKEDKDKLAEEMAAGREAAQKKKRSSADEKALKMLFIVLAGVAASFLMPILIFVAVWTGVLNSLSSEMLTALIMVISIGVPVLAIWLPSRKKKSSATPKAKFKDKMRTIAKPLAGMILAILILIFNPVSDWFYYLGAFVCMGSVLWAFTDIMKQHNVLTTRKLPQFNKRGGDGLA